MVKQEIATTGFKDLEVLAGDRVMIRMAARTNPTVYLFKKGTVIGKWSYKNFDAALSTVKQLPAVAATTPKDTTVIDSLLKK